jgi:hypothetical protein
MLLFLTGGLIVFGLRTSDIQYHIIIKIIICTVSAYALRNHYKAFVALASSNIAQSSP